MIISDRVGYIMIIIIPVVTHTRYSTVILNFRLELMSAARLVNYQYRKVYFSTYNELKYTFEIFLLNIIFGFLIEQILNRLLKYIITL